jgi:hypothetical protein
MSLYSVIVVRLKLGPEVVSNGARLTPHEVKCGRSEEVVFEKINDQVILPDIRPRIFT